MASEDALMLTSSRDEKNNLRPSLLPQSAKEQHVLLIRAARLAKKEKDVEAAKGTEAYLLFRLGKDALYGIESHYLIEVMGARQLTRLPGAPAAVIGLFNWRGKILSVLDVALLIDFPDQSSVQHHEMIVVQCGAVHVAICVDELLGFQYFDPQQLEPAMGERSSASYVRGIDQHTVTLLDIDALLNHPMLDVVAG
ncbi:MAG: chemotaxis protein CheW [Mariprofundus sp.]|nr:chemotaxis protein CheW [Mariprofundus sp.]